MAHYEITDSGKIYYVHNGRRINTADWDKKTKTTHEEIADIKKELVELKKQINNLTTKAKL